MATLTIKAALRSLGCARGALSARNAAARLLSILGYNSQRTGAVYYSPVDFLRDFPVVGQQREPIERALQGAVSYVAILFQWTVEDMVRVVGGSSDGGGSILFLLASVKSARQINRTRCEKWAMQIRRMFGARRDMSLAIIFIQDGNMIFTFTYYNGHSWRIVAHRKISLISASDSMQFVKQLSLWKTSPNSLNDVRNLWRDVVQGELCKTREEIRDLDARLLRLFQQDDME